MGCARMALRAPPPPLCRASVQRTAAAARRTPVSPPPQPHLPANPPNPKPPLSSRLRDPSDDTRKAGIRILVLSPTRELASQIAVEAGKLISHQPGMRCHVVYGGTNINREARDISAPGGAQVLVATPGRLMDHLENQARWGLGFGGGLEGVGGVLGV